MPETIGVFILSATGIGEVAGIAGLGTLAGTTVAGVGIATIVGSATILGVSIGLQYALNNPEVPRPENGAIPIKQAIPVRQRGYWINRISGPYMLFLAGGGDSQDVLALHHGRIEAITQVYMHDTAVSVVPAVSHGTVVTVQQVGGNQFRDGAVRCEFYFGLSSQPWAQLLQTYIPATWTNSFRGHGIAYGVVYCSQIGDPSEFTKVYPQGVPLLSVIARCSPVWDPRDPAQDRFDDTTWVASPNPVLQLIDYLTRSDGGMGEDLDDILPPDALAQWMEEADLCDGRYSCAGMYKFDNSPENVIAKILASCDGWMAEAGDGSLALTVGVYRPPLDDPITAKHILGWSVKDGIADEELINQLDVTFTNPALGYVSDQLDPVQDEDSISAIGYVRSKPLDLSWVQDASQANFLGQRALLRVNPAKTGTLVTDLVGLNYLGKRWIPMQFPEVPGLEDVVIEVQDRAEVDLLKGRVTFIWSLIDSEALSALGVLQQGLLREDGSYLRREDGTPLERQI